MAKLSDNLLIFKFLSELNRAFGMDEPLHPLITISDYSEACVADSEIEGKGIIMNFYDITYKKYFSGSIRYGQHHYDFAGGGLSFTSPMQLMATSGDEDECDKLNVTSGYLSDLLRSLTGLNAQQHIHEKLIEKAKERLSTTNLSVSEIAYELGFEHSQSFSKLFKTKTKLSPSEFRESFN